jgi:hypothetical protein
MAAYLMIQNPGVAPEEAFTLLGASTKRDSENGSTIGKFGTGNKHGVAVLLRNNLLPVVFAGNLKLEFGTRQQPVNDGIKDTVFNRVVVKFGGKDRAGVSRSATDDLGFVLEHGSADWLSVDLALREFVSNSLDRAVEEGEVLFVKNYVAARSLEFQQGAATKGSWENREVAEALKEYRKTATDFKTVEVAVVNDSQVRAKSGHTRIFVPLTTEVLDFFNNLGKWFLHFSEPESLNKTILPKADRNLSDRRTAVIYRRGVRVREFESSDTPSLYDYNLENLKLDESRRVDDWYVQHEAAAAFAAADVDTVARLWQSFLDGQKYWEHGFQGYGLETGVHREEQKAIWSQAFEQVAGENAVISTDEGGQQAARKGFKVVKAPQAFVQAAEKHGLRTPAKVLSDDEKAGRTIFDATPDAEAAVEFAWYLVNKYGVTNGKEKPVVKTFRKIMDAGSQTLGFYKDGVVYINQDIAASGSLSLGWHSLTQQLLVTAFEEVSHHVTGATDNSRDFQDFLLNLVVYMGKELAF